MTWKSFKALVRSEWDMMQMDAYIKRHGGEGESVFFYHKPHWFIVMLLILVSVFWYFPKYFVNTRVCHWKGHNWRDDGSYANPDHGVEELICIRCGEGYRHIYY